MPPIAFFRVGWMRRYDGMTTGDGITGGGSYVAEQGFGHEIFNFRPHQGRLLGYVQPPSRNKEWENGRINIQRLGAPVDATSVSGVLAIWVATGPSGGAYVVGWYKNATVHAGWQESPHGADREHAGVQCGYFVEARARDCVLLPPDERVCQIPQSGKGEFGQSNTWYADDPDSGPTIRAMVQTFIRKHKSLKDLPRPSKSARQPDVLTRQKVERIAVQAVIDRFEHLGYHVESVESEKCGWDLTATLARRRLRLEVKGVSAKAIAVELTHNEYEAMRKHHATFRLCVVTDALKTPFLEVFAHSPDSGRWESDSRKVLSIAKVTSARCVVK